MIIKNVGVIGCGLMGSGIVQVAAQAGFSVLFVEANDELVRRGLGRLRETLEGLVAKGKLDAAAKDAVLARIGGTASLEDLKGCDLVVEAMTENQPLKNETFAKLDRIAPPHAILATNTSSCNVTAMAAATRRPGQVLGLHFFNPVPLMKLVEVARTILTDEGVVNKVGTAILALGAREAEIGCYAIAATGKLVPSEFWRPEASPAYESTPLELFDAVITERGAKRPGYVRRAAARLELPEKLLGISI